MKNLLQIGCFWLFSCVAVNAQNLSAPAVQVPLDPQVRYGRLENGLTYYVRKNTLPAQRADFYIAQNVGAILEEDSQNGLAHFLEHMAFNGTKNYPGKGIINYLEALGVKFGENINAYTSLDETVYNLSNVPVTRPSIIDSALLVLHDWSGFISLNDEEIDKERGVIREEWRTGQTASRRLWSASMKGMFPGSQYAKRDVIGDTAIINNFTYQTLRAYYKKWYRPDLQAIVVVGDIDPQAVEQRIKALFADIPAPVNPATRIVYPIADNDEPLVAVLSDPEARSTRMEIYFKHDPIPDALKESEGAYMLSVKHALISMMLSQRFAELRQSENPPFASAGGSFTNLVRSKDGFALTAAPVDNKVEIAFEAILREARRMQLHGFLPSELDRAKAMLMSSLEQQYNEREKQRSESFVNQYVRHFLDRVPTPGIEWEYNRLRSALPAISLEEVNAVSKGYLTRSNIVVSVTGAHKPDAPLPAKESLLALLKATETMTPEPYRDQMSDKPLVETVPSPATIRKEIYHKALDLTEWQLSNGVRVLLKPTTFKEDEIMFSAWSEGGLSKVQNPADLYSASLAVPLVSSSGLGSFSSTDLNKLLAGKNVSISPSLNNYYESLSGNSSVKDLATLLQLNYLFFTAPRFDEKGIRATMNSYRTSLANVASDPGQNFTDTVQTMLSNRHPRVKRLNLAALDSVDSGKAYEIFKSRFSNGADFTFLLVGNLTPDSIKEALLTWLGGLPSDQTREKFTDWKIRYPKGEVVNAFAFPQTVKKSSNYVVYNGALKYTLKNAICVNAIGEILGNRYLETIREEQGGSYGVSTSGSLVRIPEPTALLSMRFDTDPAIKDRMLSIIHEEAEKFAKEGPRPEDFQKVREAMLKQHKENVMENSFWQSAAITLFRDGLNITEPYRQAVEKLKPSDLQKVMKTILSQKNVLEVQMMPAPQ